MAGPKVGTIEDGYRFKGGDPKSQSNWEQIETASADEPQVKLSSIPSAVGNFAKTSALPTAGSIILPAAATYMTGGAAAPYLPALSGLGSGAGEAMNQMFGITEPSLSQIGMSTAIPTALGYGANAMRTAGKFLPSSAGPGTLNALAPQEAAGRIAGMRGAQAAGPLFEKAAKEGTLVPLTKTQTLIKSVLDNPDIATAEKKAFSQALKETGVKEFIGQSPQGMNPARMQRVLAATGELQSGAEGYTGGHLKRLFGALSDDLDEAANVAGAGAATLKAARDTFKRERVLTDLDKEISSAFKINRGQGAQGQFNANKIINTLKDSSEGTGKFFSQAFSKKEQKDLIGFFEFLNEIPGLGAPAGTTRGSELLLKTVGKQTGMGMIGGGIGFAAGGPVGAGVGTAIGGAIPPSLETIKLMRMAWQMKGGKQFIKDTFNNTGGSLTPQVLSSIGAFVSGQMAQPMPSIEYPKASMTPVLPLER